jgi:protein-tyrosine phosphatase
LCDELRALAAAGVNTLVSLLTNPESEELGLAEERVECDVAKIKFVNFPIEDRSVPRLNHEFAGFVNQLVDEVRQHRSVAVHCRAGIGRSALLVACILVRLGMSPAQAFTLIQEARGCAVPDTHEQKNFVESFSRS